MSISSLTIQKINELNGKYNKRNIKSSLLHVLKTNSNDGEILKFQKEVLHEGQYNKNLEFLNKINSNHLGFFNDTIIAYADLSQNLFKSTEKIISSLELEKDHLKRFSFDQGNTDLPQLLLMTQRFYSDTGSQSRNQTFDQIEDYISGHFLFNHKFRTALISSTDRKLADGFIYIGRYLIDNLDETHTLVKEERRALLDSKKARLRNILSINQDDAMYSKINEFFKNYMSFPYELDLNAKIKNFRKNPLSLSFLAQSMINLIDQEDHMSNNSLYYGLYPVKLIQLNKLNIQQVTNFSFVQMNEILPLKYLVEDGQNEIYQSEELDDFKINSFKKGLNANTYFLSYLEKQININNDNFFNFNFERSKIHNLLNCRNENSFTAVSKVFLEGNTQKENRFPFAESVTQTNKFNLFSSVYDTSYLQGNMIEDDVNVTKPLINSDQFSTSSFKEKMKIHSLNLIELISSCINNDTMHVLEIYKDELLLSKDIVIPGTFAEAERLTGVNADVIRNNNAFGSPGFNLGGISSIALNENINVNPSRTININAPTNVGSINATGQSRRTVDIQTETYASVQSNIKYRKKPIIFSGKTGIHNVSYFEDENDFKNSILRTRKKADYIVKEIKKYQNLKFKNIFLNEDSVFKEENNATINDNDFLVDKNEYTFDAIKKDYIFLGENHDFNLIEKNMTFLEKKEYTNVNVNEKFIDLDSDNLQITNQIFNKNNYLNNVFSAKIDKDQLKHFSSSSSLFEFITNYCKKFFDGNLNVNDHNTNFSKRAKISETATLLGFYNKFSKGLTDSNKSVFREIINKSIAKKIIHSFKRNQNQDENISTERLTIFENIKDNIEYLSSIHPFYLFGENLSNAKYDQYDPYENSNDLYEKNGLFYHFLFSTYHQKKSFRYKKLNSIVDSIEEFSNSSNINENNRSPFYFSFNSKDILAGERYAVKQKISIKNVFNSGIFDYYSSNKKKINLFKPRIKMEKYNNKFSFIITHESDYPSVFTELKSYIKEYFETFDSQRNTIRRDINRTVLADDIYTSLLFPESLSTIINEQDSIIQEKNILNVASVETSFFDSPVNSFNNFLDNIMFEMFNIDYIRALVSINFLNEDHLKKLIDSTLKICNEIFLKMYFEVQGYNAVCNRLFESGVFSKGSSDSLTRNFIDNEDEKVSKFVDNLENVRNFYNLYKDFINDEQYKSFNIKNSLDDSEVRFCAEEGTFHLQFVNSIKSKPSHVKLFYALKNIFKISDINLKKIMIYLLANSEFHSKFHYVFDIFNLHSIKSQNFFESFATIQNTSFFHIIDGNIDRKMLNNDLKIMSFINDSNCIFFDYLYELSMSSQTWFTDRADGPSYTFGNLFKNPAIGQDNETKINSNLDFVNDRLNNITDYFSYNRNFKLLFEIFSIVMKSSKSRLILNTNIDNYISLNDIFSQIVSKSYEKNWAYNLEEYSIDNIGSEVISGCELINESSSSFLNYSKFNQNNILYQDSQNASVKKDFKKYMDSLSIQKKSYVDIQHNWYNHVLRGLIMNDFSYAMNMEIIKYFNSYDNGIGNDIQKIYDYIQTYRNNKHSSAYYSFSSKDAVNEIKNITGFTSFKLKNNNFELKDIYIKQFLKTKIVKNIKSKYEKENRDINSVVPSLKDEFFKCYLKDFYIEKYVYPNENSINFPVSRFINNSYSNSSNNLNLSTILTVGIEKEVEIKKNDIILLTVEMIDHDYPDLIWEKKIFEFDTSINNPVDDIFVIRDQNNRQYLTGSNLSYVNDTINIPLVDYFSSSDVSIINSGSIDRKLLFNYIISVPASPSPAGRPNISNNIQSVSLVNSNGLSLASVYIEPDLTSDINNLIERRYNELNESYISRLKLLGIEDIQTCAIALREMIQRSIFNQMNSFRLEKILKSLTGFEGKKNFSIKKEEEKFLQGCYILSNIYDLFVTQIYNSSNIEDLGFTNEELTNVFSANGQGNFENNITYKGFEFKIASMSTNHNLNAFIKFMHNFTTAIIPDLSDFSDLNFSRILNVSIKPQDFIVTTLTRGNVTMPALNSYPGLSFELISNMSDEIGTIHNRINSAIYSRQNVEIKSYRVKDNSTQPQQSYIPKNVSYRVSLDLLEN